MSELNINELPFELLVKVFQFLNFVNLKNATRTCKLWNNIIESECRWSLKLNYGRYSVERRMDFALSTNRKFGSIQIVSRPFVEIEDNQIRRIFERHGFHVVKLIICDCRVENLDRFAELLKFTPNLKHAEIHRLRSTDDTLTDFLLNCVLPDLSKLKHLVIYTTQYGIARCFRKAKLTTLTIWEFSFSDDCGLILDFLSSQETLTSLNLILNGTEILPLMEKWNVTFRLTHFMITCASLQYLPHTTSLLRFVKSQVESLTELEIGSRVPNSVYECVFASMPKLNTLSVIASQIPRGTDFYKRLKENRTVRTIKLWITFFPLEYQDLKFLGNFLQKLSNCRSLILPHSDKNTLVVAAKNLPQLESLCIESLDLRERSIVSVEFPNLKELHIRHLKVRIKWSKFTKKHPRLTKLTIQKMERDSFLTCGDIERITTNVDLQHLRLGAGIAADERFLENIRTKGTNFKLVDVPLVRFQF